jgi:uncharacterized low-complexity protein
MPLSRIVLIVAVAAFALYLVLQVRPRAQKRRALEGSIREARERAHKAKSPAARAVALVEAGEASAGARRWVAAEGFFLRAMRAEPASVAWIARAATALRPRPRVAERLFWHRLGALDEIGDHPVVVAALAGALAALYEGPIPDRSRAAVLRRLEKHEAPAGAAAKLPSATEDGEPPTASDA